MTFYLKYMQTHTNTSQTCPTHMHTQSQTDLLRLTEIYSLLFIGMVLPSAYLFKTDRSITLKVLFVFFHAWLSAAQFRCAFFHLFVSSHVCLHSGLLFPMLYLNCVGTLLLVALILVSVSAQLLCEGNKESH